MMEDRRSLREIISSGVELRHDEAVAMAQELIHSSGRRHPDLATTPSDRPLVDDVHLTRQGTVECTATGACDVAGIAQLLDAMLPRDGKTRVPGALRYALARALGDVDAPPFESTAELSAALARHEHGDRSALLRGLYARAAAPAASAAVPAVDRRRSGSAAAQLRRELREADEKLFRYEAHRAAAPPPVVPRWPASRPLAPWALGGVAAVLTAFILGHAAVDRMRVAHSTSPAPSMAASSSTQAGAATGAAPSSQSPAAPDTVVRSAAAPAPLARPAPAVPAPDARLSVPREGASSEALPQASREPAIARAVSSSTSPMFSPSFASNGTALFFHSGRPSDPKSALEAVDLSSSEPRVTTIVDDGARNYHVQPSPDGTHVAFDSDRDGERGVYIANRDGTGARLVSGSGYAAVPTWSPDGTRLAFIRAEVDRPHVWNLWLLTLASGEMERLTSFRLGQTWNASWFPDGRRICYTHEDRLIIRDVKSGYTTEYTSPVPGHLVRTPAVSPDGTHVIFQVAGRGAWLLSIGDGSMRSVLSDPTAEEFAWSPDGHRVAFHSRRDGRWVIWLLAPV